MKIGQIVKERYEILKILGEGGMAFVTKHVILSLRDLSQLKH